MLCLLLTWTEVGRHWRNDWQLFRNARCAFAPETLAVVFNIIYFEFLDRWLSSLIKGEALALTKIFALLDKGWARSIKAYANHVIGDVRLRLVMNLSFVRTWLAVFHADLVPVVSLLYRRSHRRSSLRNSLKGNRPLDWHQWRFGSPICELWTVVNWWGSVQVRFACAVTKKLLSNVLGTYASETIFDNDI